MKKEFKFKDCDGNQLYEIFSFYAGDHVSKHIPTLSIDDWKDSENGYSINIYNPLPESESSWESGLKMNKDINGELIKIEFDNRGMGGGYEISILRKGNTCKLNYYGFAD